MLPASGTGYAVGMTAFGYTTMTDQEPFLEWAQAELLPALREL